MIQPVQNLYLNHLLYICYTPIHLPRLRYQRHLVTALMTQSLLKFFKLASVSLFTLTHLFLISETTADQFPPLPLTPDLF